MISHALLLNLSNCKAERFAKVDKFRKLTWYMVEFARGWALLTYLRVRNALDCVLSRQRALLLQVILRRTQVSEKLGLY